MDLVSKSTHIVYWATSLFTFIAANMGDVLEAGNPSKEMDTQKGKCEPMEQKCFAFQKDLDELQKKTKHVVSL